MPDLDDLLTPDVSTAASGAATPPDLDSLRTRGAHRRRRRRVAAVGAAAVAVVAVLGVTQFPGREGTAPPDPAPSPTGPTPTLSEQEAAERVVDHPEARLTRIAVSADDPDVRATVWRCDPCGPVKEAIAVTSDGFETRHVLRWGKEWRLSPDLLWYQEWGLTSPGYGLLVQRPGEPPAVLGSDGSLRPVEVDEGEPRPLQEGEMLIDQELPVGQSRDLRWLGLDLETLIAHEVPMLARGRWYQVAQQPSGRIDALGSAEDRSRGAAMVMHSSDDGGATWQVTEQIPGVPLGISGGTFFHVLPSARGDVQAVVQFGEAFGYDVPVGLPSEAVSRSSDGSGWARFETPLDLGFMGPAVVLPDGRLLAWFGKVPLRPNDPRHGFYIGEEWGALEPVDMGAPFDDVGSFDLAMHMSVTEDRVVFYAVDPSSGDTAFVTEDYGETWEEVRAR